MTDQRLSMLMLVLNMHSRHLKCSHTLYCLSSSRFSTRNREQDDNSLRFLAKQYKNQRSIRINIQLNAFAYMVALFVLLADCAFHGGVSAAVTVSLVNLCECEWDMIR